MKKQLLSVFAAVAVSTVFAQTPSPDWATVQNAGFPLPSAGTKFIDAVDANVVWVVGYDGTQASRSYNWFAKSTNGGTTFSGGNIFSDTLSYVLANMEAQSATQAWVCAFQHGPLPYTLANTGGGGVFKTTDGGASWINMTAAGMFSNTAASFADFVSFFTPSVGIAVGDPVNGSYEIWRTNNAGSTWTQINGIPVPSSSNEYAITNLYCKQGNSNLWFGTNAGRVFYTNDAGSTWQVSNATVASNTITQMAFTSPLNGVVYATDGVNNYAYNTIDGGVTWSAITPLDVNMGFNDIKAVPGTNYYASVDNLNELISYSSDNGVTWTNWGSSGIPYVTLDFADNTVGWAGSFSDQTTASVGGIFKYTGTALTSTAIPASSAFTVEPSVCGPNATVTPGNNSLGSGTLSYSWTASPNDAAFSSTTAAAPAITFTSSNTYTITLTVDNGTTTNTSSQLIDVVACAAPTGSFSLPAITPCNNGTFAATSTVTPGSPAAGLIWTSSPSNGVTFIPSAAVPDPTIKAVNAGTYTITMTTANSTGSTQVTQTITVNDCRPVPSFTLAHDSLCKGTKELGVNTSSNVAGASNNSYVWTYTPTSVVHSNTNAPTPQSQVLTFNTIGVYTITLKATNSSGTATAVHVVTVTPCAVDTVTTSIAGNASLLENINAYPNPAHDQLNVSLPSSHNGYTLKLINILGTVVAEETNVKGQVSINTGNKPKGIYFLNIVSDQNEKATLKIVVE